MSRAIKRYRRHSPWARIGPAPGVAHPAPAIGASPADNRGPDVSGRRKTAAERLEQRGEALVAVRARSRSTADVLFARRRRAPHAISSDHGHSRPLIGMCRSIRRCGVKRRLTTPRSRERLADHFVAERDPRATRNRPRCIEALWPPPGIGNAQPGDLVRGLTGRSRKTRRSAIPMA